MFRKELAFVIVFLFVGASVVQTTVGIDKEKIEIITLGSRGYIQGLIDNASDGDTIYISSGIYYENIVIKKSISLVGEDKDTTIIDGDGNGTVVYISADWVNISGFSIQNSGTLGDNAGVRLYYSNNNTIKNNNIFSNNVKGIRIESSTSNTITGNDILNNKNDGIYLLGSNNIITGNNITNNNQSGINLYSGSNTITGNNITSNNNYGIYLHSESNTVTSNNIASNNYYGIYLSSSNNIIKDNTFFNDGLFVSNSHGNNVENNTVNGKPLVYLEHESDKAIDYEVGQVILVNCNKITVENLNLSNTDVGIELWKTNNSMTRNNDFSNNRLGIYIYNAIGNNITGNNILNNGYAGIDLSYSDNNNITGNNIYNNNFGIMLSHSSNNVLRNNIMVNNNRNFGVSGNEIEEFVNDVDDSNKVNGKSVYYWVNSEDNEVPLDAGYVALVSCKNIKVENLELMNNGQGVLLAETLDSTITGNIITNTDVGINLYKSDSNTILGNNIESNSGYGVRFYESSMNSITSNNVTNNEGSGVFLKDSNSNTISGNTISNKNNYGVYFVTSRLNIIKGNNIVNNSYGIFLSGNAGILFSSVFNVIIKNNFFDNELDAFFQNSRINLWSQNYWNRSRILPYLISGEIYWIQLIGIGSIVHHNPWFPKIDWRPALKPYDI